MPAANLPRFNRFDRLFARSLCEINRYFAYNPREVEVKKPPGYSIRQIICPHDTSRGLIDPTLILLAACMRSTDTLRTTRGRLGQIN
ncbi:MAG: hypothetical protein WBD56_01465, partial [Anaerolineales bacterium]